MALYIRDAKVDELARALRVATGAKSKTDAVRQALQNELRRNQRPRGFDERNAEVLAMADSLGSAPDQRPFDMKAFSDSVWNDVQ